MELPVAGAPQVHAVRGGVARHDIVVEAAGDGPDFLMEADADRNQDARDRIERIRQWVVRAVANRNAGHQDENAGYRQRQEQQHQQPAVDAPGRERDERNQRPRDADKRRADPKSQSLFHAMSRPSRHYGKTINVSPLIAQSSVRSRKSRPSTLIARSRSGTKACTSFSKRSQS